MSGPQKIAGNDNGDRLSWDGRNETRQDSSDNDPSAFRLGSTMTTEGGGGGKLSGDVLVEAHDMQGKRIELGFIRFTQSDYSRGNANDYTGMVEIFLRNDAIPDNNGNADPKYERCLLGFVGVPEGQSALELHPAWVSALRNLIGEVASSVPMNKIVSPDGYLELDMQNIDAPNLTAYIQGIAFWDAVSTNQRLTAIEKRLGIKRG